MPDKTVDLRVLLVRASGNEADANALTTLGIASVSEPYLKVASVPGADGYSAATELLVKLTGMGSQDWVVVTSANGLRHWARLYGEMNLAAALTAAEQRGVRFAAIGAASAKMYSDFGIKADLIAQEPNGSALAQQLLLSAGGGNHAALIPSGNLAMSNLTDDLTAAGWDIFARVVYETSTVAQPPLSVSALKSGQISAILLRSPSAARALVEHAGVTSVPVIAGGPTTAAAARSLGLTVIAVSQNPEPEATARVVFDALTSQNQELNHVS